MANPLTADTLLAALRAEGARVVEVGDWRTHNRNHKGPWGPVHGVMIHHTVTKGTAATVAICRDGHTDLPGPLCHGVIAKDGRVHLVGYGRANHAGLGDPDVLAAVIAERQLPVDDEASTDGNRHFYGFECENLGDNKDPWPAAQLDAIVRVSAAICRAHDWSARSVIRHLDWQPGKVDPRGPGLDWVDIEARIAERLTHAAGWTRPATPSEEDDMPTAQEIAAAVWNYPVPNRFRPGSDGKSGQIPAHFYLEWGDSHFDDLAAMLTKLTADVAARDAVLERLVADGGLDAAEAKAAAEAGAQAALDRLAGALSTEG